MLESGLYSLMFLQRNGRDVSRADSGAAVLQSRRNPHTAEPVGRHGRLRFG